jgi:hypothetical protein
MKKILSFAFLLVCLSAKAQDVITTRKGTVIQAKVTDVTPTEVKYKRFDNLDGPDYSAKKSEIASIVYKNGTVDAFNTAEDSKKTAKNKSTADKPLKEKTTEEEPKAIENNFFIALQGGVSTPLGSFKTVNTAQQTGGALDGNNSAIEVGGNFKNSRWGWTLGACTGGHDLPFGVFGPTQGPVSVYSGGGYYHTGLFGGANYALPLGPKRSALLFSAQFGHLTCSLPLVLTSTKVQLSSSIQTLAQTRRYDGYGNGFLFDLGAEYRYHFAKKWYLLGNLHYQNSSISLPNLRFTTKTPYLNTGGTWGYYDVDTDSSVSVNYTYAVFNAHLGIGFFLK